jgi:hypothetical protein
MHFLFGYHRPSAGEERKQKKIEKDEKGKLFFLEYRLILKFFSCRAVGPLPFGAAGSVGY